MGGNRFVLGFIQRALAGPKYDCEISMRIIESDKLRMREEVVKSELAQSPFGTVANEESESSDGADVKEVEDGLQTIPPLRFGTINDSLPSGPELEIIPGSKVTGWTTVNAPLCSMYAGQIPYMADNLLQFPIANSDGSIVLSILPVVSTATLLNVSVSMSQGVSF